MKPRADGFVLLEVLLAASVLAVGSILYYQALSSAMRHTRQADREYRVGLALGKKVYETELLHQPATTADQEVDPDLGQLTWTTMNERELTTGINLWTVRVSWERKGQADSLLLEAIP
ncbi:MAG: hypothetical protein JNK54_10505 [Elusimicrobia bacterium]|jgi:Tfp pilus assembly protein PilV|nr:hypothetical protein [Elusimicrobiota bacterium]